MSEFKPYDKPVLLYDGVCNLCNWIVKFTIQPDKTGKFLYAALQREKGQELLKHFGLNTNDFDSFVLVTGNKYYTRSSAALKVMKIMGGAWSLLYAFIIIPKPIRDFFYNLIAKNRYKLFGKQEACLLPRPEWKERFLD